MTDPIDAMLHGLDSPRPLPEALRDRLTGVLVAAAQANGSIEIPAGADERIEAALLAATVLPADLDRPRPLPAAMHARLSHRMLAAVPTRSQAPPRSSAPTAHRSANQVLTAAAVVALLLLGLLTVLTRDSASRRQLADGRVPQATSSPVPGEPRPMSPEPSGSPATPQPTQANPPARPSGANDGARSAGPTGSGATSGSRSGLARRGAPPPHSGEGGAALRPAPAAAPCPSPCTAPPAAAPPPPPDVVIGVALGDADVEAGFRGYLAELASAGGIGGRRVRTVTLTASRPATDTIASVNLSAGELADWSGGPLLEGLTVTESRLRAEVFSVGSVVERQAHLAADAAYPQPSTGATAVIYTGSGEPWAQRVPAAFESVLRARGVAVTRVPFRGDAPVIQPADAAFLSLPPDATADWVRVMGGVEFVDGVHATYPLHDEALARGLRDGAGVMSPYRSPTGSELAALRGRAGRPLSARVLHGWATAKHLAVATWRSGATTSAEMHRALNAMAGYDSQLAPPYEVRDGTTSRTPEGLLHVADAGVLRPSGGFRRDSY